MWYKKRWLTEPDAEAMLEAKDKKIEELTEKLLSDDRQISAYDIEVNELRDKLQSDDRQIALYDDELQQAWRQGFVEGKKAHDKRIIEIAKHYGALVQREQFVEECSEAILAAQKSKRTPNPKTISDLQGEVADVLIMALQMRYLFGAEAVDRFVELKLTRQIERIKEEQGNENT